MEWFSYCWVWNKKSGANFLNAKKMPLKIHEDVIVFSKKQPNYYPQMTKGKYRNKKSYFKNKGDNFINNNLESIDNYNNKYYPKSIITFSNANQTNKEHPTQKPVDLFEYLIKTYTNRSEIVLDNTIGSGTTAVACLKTNRKFIGFEKEEKYYSIALKRIGKFDKSYYNELPKEEKPKQKQLF